MTNNSKKLVFFGNERLATGVDTKASTLKSLIEAGFEVVAVVVNNKESTSRQNRDLEVAKVAESAGIPVLSPQNPKDIIAELSAYNCPVGVLVAYGRIVPKALIDIFPEGIINIHPSLLPKHRGPTPIESIILSGEQTTGVSLMRLAKEMDSGPVFAQKTYTLEGSESKQELADKLLNIGSELLVTQLTLILNGELKPTPQDSSLATVDELISKSDGVIEWTKSAARIEREIRAYLGWPGSSTNISGTDVTLTAAKQIDGAGTPGMPFKISKSSFGIYCGQDALEILSLKPSGKAEMSAAGFMAGYSL